MRALRLDRRAIPLLVQANADRPVYLEHLNYRDFSDPARYGAALQALYDRYRDRGLVVLAVPLGAMQASFAAMRGQLADDVVVTDVVPYRLALAEKLGASLTIDVRTRSIADATGLPVIASEITIAEALKPLGYRVALSGKRHISPPDIFSFEQSAKQNNPDMAAIEAADAGQAEPGGVEPIELIALSTDGTTLNPSSARSVCPGGVSPSTLFVIPATSSGA